MSELFAYVIGIIVGAVCVAFLWLVFDSESEPERDCDYAAVARMAFQQCLRHRPACESITVDDFIAYHENKNWLEANCPGRSGDDFLSQ